MLTTILDLLAVFLLVMFAWFVWPPLALLAASLACVGLSWSLSGRPRPARRQKRRGERS